MSFLQDLLGSVYKEGMTEEELSAAIEKAVKAKDTASEAKFAKLKASFDKTSSEVASYKKQLADKLTDDEKAKAEQAELMEKLKTENEAYKKASEVADYRAKFIAMGYDEETAGKTAEALYDGDFDTVFTNSSAAWAAKEKAIKAGEIKKTPTPPAGAPDKPVTRDSIMEIKDATERQAAIAEHLDLFEH